MMDKKTISDISKTINKIDTFRERYRSAIDMTEADLALAHGLLLEYKESLLSKKVECDVCRKFYFELGYGLSSGLSFPYLCPECKERLDIFVESVKKEINHDCGD